MAPRDHTIIIPHPNRNHQTNILKDKTENSEKIIVHIDERERSTLMNGYELLRL